MTLSIQILPGLPAYGPPAVSIPARWGRLGREGLVVAFETASGRWVANFERGLAGLDFAAPHPDGRRAVVVASGDLWEVDVEGRTAQHVLPGVLAALDVEGPSGWILDCQGLALARLGPTGLLWHTRRLAWDGFDSLRIVSGHAVGSASSPVQPGSHPFRVDLCTGRSEGSSYDGPSGEEWEKLAPDARTTDRIPDDRRG